MQRLKGRVIGAKGKARKAIEELTQTNISVYGKTIAIIGEIQNVGTARRAIESLLMGSMHATVFKWLEKQRRDKRWEMNQIG
jgi:ribosomal RNA assembly protein